MSNVTLSCLSIIMSFFSLILSLFTVWLLYLYKGKIKMTQPTWVAFGYDGPGIGESKIYLRTLIVSTAKRGRIIENIFLKVHRGESLQNFNIWVYGQKNNLSRGSGIYIGQDGVVCDHHFLLPKDCANYEFSPGSYKIEIFFSILGVKKDFLVRTLELVLSHEHVKNIKEGNMIFFDWAPNTKTYYASVYDSKKQKTAEDLKIIEKFMQTT